MSKIQVLDQITIDKIAAGEVIERPASIAKELTENAIDAGATSVTVEAKEGGIAFMRIADNGCGIDKSEVPSAFLRHSTSKIRSVEDLTHIGSLGFRGEALSSIAAVSQVELITKTKEDTFGTRYKIAGGREEGIEDTGAPDGTTFLIRQLFYNTPARRKFLKTPMTEASHVGDLMTRMALSHPEISFQFINNGQSKLHTSGNGNLKDVIYHIYGREIASNLMAVDYDKNGLKITGFLGAPLISRGNRNFENYFINGRYIKSNIVYKAIEDAYKDFSMQHKYPFVVLHIEIDGEHVDVNVHPTKMELRFNNQQEVYNGVYEAVSRGLHEKELIPHVTLDVPQAKPQKMAEVTRKAPERVTETSNARSSVRPAEKPETQTPLPIKEAEKELEQLFNKIPDKVAEGVSFSVAKPEAVKPAQQGTAVKDAAAQPKPVPVQQTPAQPAPQKIPAPADRTLDYFMEQMKKRVTAYHEQQAAMKVQENATTEYTKEEPAVSHASQFKEETVYQVTKQSETPEQEKPLEQPKQPEKEAPAENEQLNLFEERLLDKEVRAEYQLIGQVFDTYWLVQYHDNLYIIDQHAAHERVLYEKTLKSMKTREFTSQMMSPPIILNLTMTETGLLREYMDQFTRIGFEFEEFGQDSYAVRAIPDNLFGIAKKDLLMEMIDSLSDEMNRRLSPDLIDEKIASMSCKAAVKGNMKLSAAEVDALIGELLTLDNPYHCPHGRPTIIAMSKRELEKKFKRII